MGIRRKRAEQPGRAKVRLSEEQRLVDVARKLFHDDRVVPLLADLNPKLGHGELPTGTVIELPTQDEARQFASQMGFSLGFDPAQGHGTKAKRAWNKMKSGGSAAAAVDPAELALMLGKQGLPPDQVARRLMKLVDEPSLTAWLALDQVDGVEGTREPEDTGEALIQAVKSACSTLRARARVRARLKQLGGILEATSRPAAKRALLEAACAEPEATQTVLTSLLAPPNLAQAILDAGAFIAPHLARAAELAAKDPVLRDAGIDEQTDEDARAILRELVMAHVDGVDVLGPERLSLLGLDQAVGALTRHTGQIAALAGRLVEIVDDTPVEVVTALAAQESEQASAARLPKPWPAIAAVFAKLGGRLDALHAGAQDRGPAALVGAGGYGQAGEGGGPTMSAAELAARAAANARFTEAHDDVPERLAQTMVALFDPLRPSAPDTGSDGQQKQRRRTRVESALLVPREEASEGRAIATVVEELFAAFGALDDGELARRARRMPAPVRKGCLQLADQATLPLPALLREASPVARAMVLVAMALDVEVGPTLARSSGREAALEMLKAHGTRAITLTVQRYVQG